MASAKLRETALNSPKLLYKFLLRECEKLPKDAQQFYKHSIKQVNFMLSTRAKKRTSLHPRDLTDSFIQIFEHFLRIVAYSYKQHIIEPDEERVQQIMKKAVQDAEWIINKYCKTEQTAKSKEK
nr:LYR motif-containing protein 9-like [Nomia melanderi]